jgi:glycosyltransferase involved in cell wall biosynthesis
MPSTPRTSVIVPCHNYGRFLVECLDSVRAQDTSDWECLIVDNASTDDTRAVALPYTQADPRFRYLYLEPKGVSLARNLGIRKSSGEYILGLP